MLKRVSHLKGKRKLGVFVTQDNGIIIYVALKKHADIDKARAASISAAMRSGEAGWALDVPTLMKARTLGCKYIAVKLRRENRIWLTRFENYMNPSRTRFTSKGKTMSRILPLGHFVEVSHS